MTEIKTAEQYTQESHELAAALGDALGMRVEVQSALDDLQLSLSSLRKGICCLARTTLRVPALGQNIPARVTFAENGGRDDKMSTTPSFVFVDANYHLAPNAVACALRAFLARVPAIRRAMRECVEYDMTGADVDQESAIRANERTNAIDVEKIKEVGENVKISGGDRGGESDAALRALMRLLGQ